jgi:DNA-binding MarR family transcriptional regulator
VLRPRQYSPGLLVRVAQQVHSRIWTAEVSDLLTSPQFGVLRVLRHEPGLDQRAVGEQVLLDKATGGDVIGRVVRRGWVLSRQDPQDRRRNLLRLTAPGQRLLDAAVPAAERVQLALMEPLTRSERRALTAVLLTLARSGALPVPTFIARTPGALIRVVQQVHNRMWISELPDGITPLQYAVLAALVREPGLDQRTVAQRVVMDKATGAGVVARLVARRWLRTRQDREDRRRNLLSVTAAGQRLVDDARPRSGRVQRRFLLPLSVDEQDCFQRLTARVAQLGPEQADCDTGGYVNVDGAAGGPADRA